mgnify:FL=1
MKQYICGSTKYVFAKGYIMLPIEVTNLPPTIEVEGATLTRKSSFHVSLVSVKEVLARKGDILNEEIIVKNFCDFVATHEVSLVGYTNEFRFAYDRERATVVVRCTVSNLEPLFNYLNQKLQLDLEVPPTHVTLYTLQSEVGIGLISQADLETKTKIITDQIPAAIKQVFNL